MAGKSPIEWTEHTWNPFAGCSIVSPGCTNCYAMKMAARLDAMGQPLYRGLAKPSKAGPVWRGTIRRASDDVLLAPLRRKKPTTYFVNSMSDLFYETFPDEWIDRVFAVMALCPQHTFQVLTKRAERMRVYMTRGGPTLQTIAQVPQVGRGIMTANTDWPLPNVWLGVSTERQQEADERIPLLLQTPAAVRFISAEPLLGPIDLAALPSHFDGEDRPLMRLNALRGKHLCGPAFVDAPAHLDWVIVGGESGPDARPMHPDWARSLRDQCAAAGVSFFFKQFGAWKPVSLRYLNTDEGESEELAGRIAGFQDQPMHRVGKKIAGRLLDGKEHNGFPVTRTERAA